MTDKSTTINSTSNEEQTSKGEFQRICIKSSLRLSNTTKPKPPEPFKPRPLHISRMLALAHKMRETIDNGEVASAAQLAKQLKFTRARISQLLDLTLLAPDIQEEILFAEIKSGYDPINEHALREILREKDWAKQRDMWDELFPEGLSQALG